MGKETQLKIRIDEDLKKAFLGTCKQVDRNGSQVLREFMRAYVAKNGQGKLL